MSSGDSPRWKRWFLYRIPGLFRVCPEGNYHWRWERWCVCQRIDQIRGEPSGVVNLKTGKELS